MELRFPSSQCNPFPFAFHFRHSQAINRGSVSYGYFQLLLASLFPFKESLATIHPSLIQTRNLFATHYLCARAEPLPNAAHDGVGFRAQAATLAEGTALG